MFFKKEKLIQVGIVVIIAGIIIALSFVWQKGKEEASPLPSPLPLSGPFPEDLTPSPNARPLSSEEVEKILSDPNLIPLNEKRSLTEEEKQRILESMNKP